MPFMGFSGSVIYPKEIYVVRCKGCTRFIPAGVAEFPVNSIIVKCGLCGEKRRYRIIEVFLGHPDHCFHQQAQSLKRSR